MFVAGVLAAFAVLLHNSVLIVGAMAMSPDLLPVTAACVGIIGRRPRLFTRSIGTLALGLSVAILTAAAVTYVLDATGYLEAKLPTWTEWRTVTDRTFKTTDNYAWKLSPGQTLDVRVTAKDKAGNSGSSAIVRVPGNEAIGASFPKPALGLGSDWPPVTNLPRDPISGGPHWGNAVAKNFSLQSRRLAGRLTTSAPLGGSTDIQLPSFPNNCRPASSAPSNSVIRLISSCAPARMQPSVSPAIGG